MHACLSGENKLPGSDFCALNAEGALNADPTPVQLLPLDLAGWLAGDVVHDAVDGAHGIADARRNALIAGGAP